MSTQERENLQLQLSLLSVISPGTLIRHLASNLRHTFHPKQKDQVITRKAQDTLAELKDIVGEKAIVSHAYHPIRVLNSDQFLAIFKDQIGSVDFPDIEPRISIFTKIPRNFINWFRALKNPEISGKDKLKFLPSASAHDGGWMFSNQGSARAQEQSVAQAVELQDEKPVMVRLNTMHFVTGNAFGTQKPNKSESKRLIEFITRLHKQHKIKVAIELSGWHTHLRNGQRVPNFDEALNIVYRVQHELQKRGIEVGLEIDLGHLAHLKGSHEAALDQLDFFLNKQTIDPLPVFNISINPSVHSHFGVAKHAQYVNDAMGMAGRAAEDGNWEPIIILEHRAEEWELVKQNLLAWLDNFKRSRQNG